MFYTKTTTSLSAALLGGARKLTVVAKGLIAVAEGVIAGSCCVRGLQTESLVGNRYLGGSLGNLQLTFKTVEPVASSSLAQLSLAESFRSQLEPTADASRWSVLAEQSDRCPG